MEIKISICINEEDLRVCSNVRKSVFGDEEHAPKELYIIDNNDKLETTRNFIAYCENIPVATVRYIKIDDTTIKIQRMSVIKKYRKKGIAKKLLNYLEEYAYKNDYRIIIMDSAQSAVEFYKKSGYKENSDIFFEDNRPHIKMSKLLN